MKRWLARGYSGALCSLLSFIALGDELYWEQERIDEHYGAQIFGDYPFPAWKRPFSNLPILIGGGVRYQYQNSDLFEPEDNVTYEEKYLQRYSFHIDAYLSESSRVFLQLNYADEIKSNAGTSPVDENNLELQQALYQYKDSTWDLRVGKQEVVVDEQTLFGARDGTNVRRNHMAFWGLYKTDRHQFSFLTGSPIDNHQGSWRDEVNHDERYYLLTWNNPHLQLGYAFYRSDNPLVGNDSAYRNMVSAAFEREWLSMAFRNEWYLQWGHSGDQDIVAWRFTGDIEKELSADAWLVVALDVASGGVSSGKIKTFDSMYMRGDLLSELSSFTASNLITLHPYLEYEVEGGWEIKLESSFYWRYSEEDTLYSPSRFSALSADLEDAFVGVAFAIAAEWEVHEQLELEVSAGRLFFSDDVSDQGVDHSSEVEISISFQY